MKALVIAIIFSVGCISSVPVKKADINYIKDLPNWCFKAEYKPEKKTRKAMGCYENKSLCNSALKAAKRYGKIVGIKSLEECAKFNFCRK